MSAGCLRAPLITPLRLPTEGQHKDVVSDRTRFEISTDVPSAQIFFTIDGSRPDPYSWKRRRLQSGPTYLFREPFTLPPGIKSIKAMAFLPSTNQESNVVTKTFEVTETSADDVDRQDHGDNGINGYDFLKESKSEKNKVPKKHLTPSYSSLARQKLKMDAQVSFNKTSDSNGRYKPFVRANYIPSSSEDSLEQSPGKSSLTKVKKLSKGVGSADRKLAFGKDHHNADRLRRKIDTFRCPTCLVARSVNPQVAFCSICGTSLPKLPSSATLSTPEMSDEKLCSSCGSRLATNYRTCLVCDFPKRAMVPNSNSLDRRVCSACGSLNPTKMKFCLICETALPLTAASIVNIAPLIKNLAEKPTQVKEARGDNRPTAQCRICSRLNAVGARFCDWCGIQEPCETYLTKQTGTYSTCPMCYWQLPSDAKFCSQCGLDLIALSKGSSAHPSPSNTESDVNLSKSLTVGRNRIVAAQTSRPFHPGGNQNTTPKQYATSPTKPRPIAIAPISPGKGLWRMQLEHIVTHLKAFVGNNPDFQKVIGRPRIGKLVSSEIDENRPGEVSIMLTFRSHSTASPVDSSESEVEAKSPSPTPSPENRSTATADLESPVELLRPVARSDAPPGIGWYD